MRARLLALALAVLLPGFCVIALNQYELRQSRRAEVRQTALLGARYAKSDLQRVVSGVEAVLITASESPVVLQGSAEDCDQYFRNVVAKTSIVAALAAVSPEGAVRCASQAGGRGINVADKPYFRDALASRSPVIGEYAIGRASGRPRLPIALAARNPAGEPVGVLVAAIDLDWLAGMLNARGLPPGGSMIVADRNGTILARLPDPQRFEGSRIPEEYIWMVHAPSSGVQTVTTRDGDRRILGYAPISEPPVGIFVGAGRSAADSFGAIDMATRIDALYAAIATLATIAIAWSVGQRAFVDPLRRIEAAIGRWREGEKRARTGFSPAEGEIGALGANIDDLFDEIARGHEQRDLIARELSHRIKNTFATVIAIANATFRKADPAADALETFLSRMTALARTHDVLIGERVEGADLGQLVRRVVSPLCDDVDDRFRIGGPAVELPPREALAMTLVLHELCTNALKYGALGGSGRIEVKWAATEGPSGRRLELTWFEPSAGRAAAPVKAAKGFGTRLIGVAFGDAGTSKLSFEPEGVICVIELELPVVADPPKAEPPT